MRLTSYSAYSIVTCMTVLFLASGIPRLEWFGALCALFLIDRVLRIREGEKSLNELIGTTVNIAEAITPRTYRLLNFAFRKTQVVRQDFYLLLMKELVKQPDVREGLRRLDINPADFSAKIESNLVEHAARTTQSDITDSTMLLSKIEEMMRTAYGSARDTEEKFIEPRNIFVALATIQNPEIARLFDLFEIAPEDVQEAVIFGRWRRSISGIRRLPAVLGGFAHRPNFLRHRVMNRAWTARPTPTLDQYSTDLTDLARAEKVGFLIGHEREFETLLNIIARPGKPNAILLGAPGAGKSTMIAHLAFRMIKDRVPPVLFDKRLVQLEMGGLLANATPEVLAARFQKIVEEILLAGNIVLYLPMTHDLFRTAQIKGGLNPIDILLPIVKSEAIPTIGETFPREFKQYIEPRSDFLNQFEVVEVEEISEAEALRFLIYSSLLLEREFKMTITFKALAKAVFVAHRYLRNKLLPGSALDLLKQALARAVSGKQTLLTQDDIIAIAEEQSKVPIQKAGALETEKLLNLEAIIHEKLVDQEAAVSAVARAFREYRSGLSRQIGPIATFLFVGPTGVGKTELAKILTAIQFGSKDLMHRFDMSEYQDKQSIFRFIGTPDGEKTGALTDAVLNNPYCLVLLDEFEKAHPDILNLFLQVFDDGRLTDSLGRTVDFKNTVIIATSNAHSKFIKQSIEAGRSSEEVAEELKKKLTDYFKPELINRFSDVIVFRTLRLEEIYTIAGFLIKDVATVLRDTHGIKLTVDDAAVKKIAELGYSPVFGARPLRAVISEKIRSALAEKILRKEITRGNTLQLVFEGGKFDFKITV